MWVNIDNQGRVVGTNPHDMTGNSDWHFAEGAAPGELFDARGIAEFKFENGSLQRRTQAEKDADYIEPEQRLSDGERINQLEEAIDLILSGVTE